MTSTAISKHFWKIFTFTFKIHPNNSSIQNIDEISNLLIVSIPKPFGTQFVAQVRNALAAIRTIWAALIHFSNKKATNNDEQAAAHLKQYFLNFECYVKCCTFEDLLRPISFMSLGIQADTGSSLAEAPRHADQMRLQLD